MGQPPGVADVRLGPIAITTMPKHTFSVMTRSKSEQGLPAVARPTLGFAAVGPALLLACAIASNTGRGSDRWYGRTASVSSNDEVAPASGRSRSLRASPRRCCRSSGAAAPRPAAARLLLPACGTLDRFRDRAREDGGAGVDSCLIDRGLYRNGTKGGSSRTVRRGLLP